MSRYSILACVAALFATQAAALEKPLPPVEGTWALQSEIASNAYVLASRGVVGVYLICFEAGNVRSVAVAVGEERSVLARGSCTMFAPSQQDGIVVGFADDNTVLPSRPVALGSFQVIIEPTE